MFKKVYNDMTVYQLINAIHMECDTSSGLHSMTDDQVITIYKQVFGIVDVSEVA